MLNGIDISNWQRGFNLEATRPGFCIVKATEGTDRRDELGDEYGIVQYIVNNMLK
jgi:GH25 family lysozyme M1 (1,4-beta-N-acetylmuramidase)|nr:MAG TPA: LysA-like protein [Bacteriophage sp.]